MSHETPTIEVTPRDRIGSTYAQRLRRAGRLPAVIYGHKRDPVAVSMDAKEIITHLEHGAHVVTLNVKGVGPETCLVKVLQFGYLGNDVIHVDFARVDLEEEVEVRVRLNFVGQPHAAGQAGAILTHDLTDLEVICVVNAIPEEIRVDLALMGEGTVLTVGAIELPPGIRAIADPTTPVTHVSFVKQEEEAVGEEAEIVPAPGEPEVITEAKPEESDKKPESSS